VRELEKGFKQLNLEDQELLKKWFSVPPGASVKVTCQIIAERAPDMICEDLVCVNNMGSRGFAHEDVVDASEERGPRR
jgi:hypothetical protein